jgi:predicted phosphodiesterase
MNNVLYIRRVGLIGDVHAEAGLLEQSIRFLQGEGVDTLLCMGDLVDGFGDIDRCCELLEQENVYTVLGNHDRWCLRGELRNLPECHFLRHSRCDRSASCNSSLSPANS